MKKALKICGIVVAMLLAVVIAYLAYLVIDYSRIEDNLTINIDNVTDNAVPLNKEFRVMSLNFGFGAYSRDYSFFMDGGKYSRAYSKDEVIKNLNAAVDDIKDIDADIIALQEVDIDGTRSYHVDEMTMFASAFSDYSLANAVNYDSSYLFYPFTSPHGANKSGLMTLSKYSISSAVRRSLPIEDSLMKFLDLDRCYTKSYIPVNDSNVSEKYLCVYNLHLSAYTSDGTVATEQLKMLINDIAGEYECGNFCIAMGDFNMDLLGDSSLYFDTIASYDDYTWAKPIDNTLIENVAKLYAPSNLPSCRNADKPYESDGSCFVITVDGLLCTKNVDVINYFTYDTDFEYSDHQPVVFDIILKEE